MIDSRGIADLILVPVATISCGAAYAYVRYG